MRLDVSRRTVGFFYRLRNYQIPGDVTAHRPMAIEQTKVELFVVSLAVKQLTNAERLLLLYEKCAKLLNVTKLLNINTIQRLQKMRLQILRRIMYISTGFET